MEVSYPTEPVLRMFDVVYICDNCEQGHMYCGNVMLTLNPPLFPHKCDKCGHTENLTKQYPTREYG